MNFKLPHNIQNIHVKKIKVYEWTKEFIGSQNILKLHGNIWQWLAKYTSDFYSYKKKKKKKRKDGDNIILVLL